jgi:hypothetical protein
MACITLFAQPSAMTTTELVPVVQPEDASTWRMETRVERISLRMSWVVVTDSNGNRHLRGRWAAADVR